MLIRVALLVASLAAGAPAAAGDQRIRTLFYDPHAIVTISGRPNIEATIAFAPDEHIENIAIGDSAAWQVTPNKRANLLFLKPQQPRGRTNLTVVTDQRTYLFDLVAQPGTMTALYALQFTYPAPPPAPVEPIRPITVAATAAAPTASPVDLNFRWTTKGARRLLPHRLFDDGKAVYLSWDADVPMPAMLAVSADGTEGPVNYSVKGDFVVVEGVPGRLILRAGKESASLDRASKPTTETTAAAKTAER